MKVMKNIGLSAFLAASLLFLGCSHDSDDNDGTPSVSNTAPVADAGVDQHIKTTTKVMLDASASNDADHDQLTYSWSVQSIPADSKVTLSDVTSSHPTFTTDKDGTYTFSLVVNDGTTNSEDTNASTVTVTADTINSAPIANAGSNQNVKTQTPHDSGLVTLDASKSSDANNDKLTYAWVASMPANSTATLSDATSSHPTFTADVDGVYSFRLVVNDSTMDSADTKESTVTVTAATSNSAPMADAGTDHNAKTASAIDTGLITLDASNSSDADLDTLTYKWSITGTPTGSTATLSSAKVSHPTFTADLDGSYVLKLIVNDGTVDSAPVTVTITTDTTNSAPMADAGQDQNVKTKSIHDAGIVYLDGSASSDADNTTTLTYSWSIQSSPANSTATLSDANISYPEFIADKDGSYVVNLTVNDGTVDSAVSTVTITADLKNSTPVADAGIDQHVDTHTSHNSGLVTLDANASSDADHDTLTYKWSIQSAPTGSAATLLDANTSAPTFDADVDGTYVMNLVVNDSIIDSVPATVTITASTTNSKPVASINAGATSVFTHKDNIAQLDASSSTDADGDSLTYIWHIKSSPAGSNAALSNTTAENPTLTPDVNGSYVIQLIVNDGTVDSDKTKIRVTVNKLTNDTLKDLVKAYKADPTNTQLANNIIKADISEVTSLAKLFYYDYDFNLDISKWDTSKVTDMSYMFSTASDFNQPLEWDVNSVTNMNAMFQSARSFDQDISGWILQPNVEHTWFDESTSSDWKASEKPHFY